MERPRSASTCSTRRGMTPPRACARARHRPARGLGARRRRCIVEIGSGQGHAIVARRLLAPRRGLPRDRGVPRGPCAHDARRREGRRSTTCGSSRRTRPRCSRTCCPRHPSTSSGCSSPIRGTRTSTPSGAWSRAEFAVDRRARAARRRDAAPRDRLGAVRAADARGARCRPAVRARVRRGVGRAVRRAGR